MAPFFASSALKMILEATGIEIKNIADLDFATLYKGYTTGVWELPILGPDQKEVILVVEAPLFPPAEGTVTEYVDR